MNLPDMTDRGFLEHAWLSRSKVTVPLYLPSRYPPVRSCDQLIANTKNDPHEPRVILVLARFGGLLPVGRDDLEEADVMCSVRYSLII